MPPRTEKTTLIANPSESHPASTSHRRIAACVLLGIALATLSATAQTPAAPAAPVAPAKPQWNGYEIQNFKVDGRDALMVLPKTPAPGKPWIWRTEFFGIDPQADIALLGKGLHVGYFSVGGLFGAPVAITGALLIQLGFKPLQASALSLIANTAPVASERDTPSLAQHRSATHAVSKTRRASGY